MTERYTVRQFGESEGADDWRVLGDGACACFRTGSIAAGARLLDAIAALDGTGPHRPDVDVRSDGVTVRIITMTDDHYGLTKEDSALARRISAAARELGLTADPSAVQTLQVSIDALVHAAVVPFWRAVLGYGQRGPDDLVDLRGRGAPFWFQQMDEPRPQRNRVHIDLWVPHDRAAARIEAAIAAGGRLVTDAHAPEWWVLADPEGNEVCVATTLSRG